LNRCAGGLKLRLGFEPAAYWLADDSAQGKGFRFFISVNTDDTEKNTFYINRITIVGDWEDPGTNVSEALRFYEVLAFLKTLELRYSFKEYGWRAEKADYVSALNGNPGWFRIDIQSPKDATPFSFSVSEMPAGFIDMEPLLPLKGVA
jgi:hypothetical protein